MNFEIMVMKLMRGKLYLVMGIVEMYLDLQMLLDWD